MREREEGNRREQEAQGGSERVGVARHQYAFVVTSSNSTSKRDRESEEASERARERKICMSCHGSSTLQLHTILDALQPIPHT